MRKVVDSKAELERAMYDYETAGWSAVEKAGWRVVMERDLRGRWLWHLLYFFLAPVYGNLVYSGYRRFDRPKQVVIRIEGYDESDGEETDENSDDADIDETINNATNQNPEN